MTSIIEDLKAQARILHRQAEAGEASAVARVRSAGSRDEPIRRAHCLATLARELGFDGWGHAKALLSGEPAKTFGTLLYAPACSAHWNIWCASYDEARDIRAEHGGYLLAYKHQFLIVERHFIDTLGLDPDDPDWERIGRDWVRPGDVAARGRLYDKLVRARQAAASKHTAAK